MKEFTCKKESIHLFQSEFRQTENGISTNLSWPPQKSEVPHTRHTVLSAPVQGGVRSLPPLPDRSILARCWTRSYLCMPTVGPQLDTSDCPIWTLLTPLMNSRQASAPRQAGGLRAEQRRGPEEAVQEERTPGGQVRAHRRHGLLHVSRHCRDLG